MLWYTLMHSNGMHTHTQNQRLSNCQLTKLDSSGEAKLSSNTLTFTVNVSATKTQTIIFFRINFGRLQILLCIEFESARGNDPKRKQRKWKLCDIVRLLAIGIQ